MFGARGGDGVAAGPNGAGLSGSDNITTSIKRRMVLQQKR